MKVGSKLPDNPAELKGISRAAILLMTLDTPTASALLKKLTPQAVEEVTRELAGLGPRFPIRCEKQVVEEYYALASRLAVHDRGRAGLRERCCSRSRWTPRPPGAMVAADPDAGAEDPVQFPAEGRDGEPADVHPG